MILIFIREARKLLRKVDNEASKAISSSDTAVTSRAECLNTIRQVEAILGDLNLGRMFTPAPDISVRITNIGENYCENIFYSENIFYIDYLPFVVKLQEDLKEMISRIDVPEVTPRLLTPEEREQLRERNERELAILRERRRRVDECVNIFITTFSYSDQKET
jgi:hypothetical protein